MSSRKLLRKLKQKDPPELNITTFLNLMVVLIPFLLITAVFSRITILQLNLPAGVGADEADDKKLTLEVIVRENGIDIGDGQQIVTRFPNNEVGEYDIEGLTRILREIKYNFPDKIDSTVLMEPDLEYDILVRIMDTVSSTVIEEEDGTTRNLELFPQISVGDAPGLTTSTISYFQDGFA
jgi:biopolymer transport protein ExbD